MLETLFLLLPVAAASGWWLSRRELRATFERVGPAHPDFLRGLNYLLEEQPDKAIDLFLKLTEVDQDTVETHLALGNLFRRRGEVDRAIRIHQNLVARTHLSTELRGYALFELGQDYMCAGLLDRAEVLFQELVDCGLQRQRALLALRDLYQCERDWRRCLAVAEQIKPVQEPPLAVEIAHYHCELAEEAQRNADPVTARRELALALRVDPNCVRAAMLEGRAALADGQPQRAVTVLLRVAERGATYVAEILPELIEALQHLERDDVLPLLEALAQRHPSPPLLRSLAEVVAAARGETAALDVMTAYLTHHADLSVLERMLALQIAQEGIAAPLRQRLQVTLAVTRTILARQPVYQCEHCGFQARTLHWQCPSCKRWGTVVPVQPEPTNAESLSPVISSE
ncbi:lipopolysaccharide assembly protein LapB [Chromatium okenii]|uniref:lipopolysaccharide assembly protein LapB n=1 Tax=Chromatium okenii TaxID=61644 RepID=UPI0019038195|nr:lipopolysaccharide assembly protein LapB [Chromatium okenii]MBK1640641.1 lipopolysaccharide assembly protein LapB [Chromatium okenii]